MRTDPLAKLSGGARVALALGGLATLVTASACEGWPRSATDRPDAGPAKTDPTDPADPPHDRGRATGSASLIPASVDTTVVIPPSPGSPWGAWLSLRDGWSPLVEVLGLRTSPFDLSSREKIDLLGFDPSFEIALVWRGADVAIVGVPASDAALVRALDGWFEAQGTGDLTSAKELVGNQPTTVVKSGGKVAAVAMAERGWRVLWPGPSWDGGNSDPLAAAKRWIDAGLGQRLITSPPFVAISSTLGTDGVVRGFGRTDDATPVPGTHYGFVVDDGSGATARVRAQVYQEGPQRAATAATASPSPTPAPLLAAVADSTLVVRGSAGANWPGGMLTAALSDEARDRLQRLAERRLKKKKNVDLAKLGPSAWTGNVVIGIDRWSSDVLDEFVATGKLELIPTLFEGVIALEIRSPEAAAEALENVERLSKRVKLVGDGRGQFTVEGDAPPMRACLVGGWLILASSAATQVCDPEQADLDAGQSPQPKPDGASSEETPEEPSLAPGRRQVLELETGFGLDRRPGETEIPGFVRQLVPTRASVNSGALAPRGSTLVVKANATGVAVEWVLRK